MEEDEIRAMNLSKLRAIAEILGIDDWEDYRLIVLIGDGVSQMSVLSVTRNPTEIIDMLESSIKAAKSYISQQN